MREIKFRAWDTLNKKMIYLDWENDFIFSTAAVNAYPIWFVENLELGTILTGKDGVIQQYTGLKDKNGKEVYEGDIVRSSMGHIDEIVWSSGCFCLARAMMMYELTYGLDGFEVIGNIYENPDLIK